MLTQSYQGVRTDKLLRLAMLKNISVMPVRFIVYADITTCNKSLTKGVANKLTTLVVTS
jgi:hypothetical protein